MSAKLDPVTLEVIRNALPAIANEMAADLQRTSYNMMIYEVRDFCTALVSVDGDLISQNVGGVSHFVADLGVIISDAVKRYGRKGFRPGDVIVTNHPAVAGQHLNNVVIYVPYFFKGELLAFFGARLEGVMKERGVRYDVVDAVLTAGYDDMVDAHQRLVAEHLGFKRVRLVIGNSQGGMHTWLWGEKYPSFMDALVPMASQPTEMAARNWMLRRAMLETIRNDPDYNGGNYTAQPRMMRYAIVAYGIASAGGTLAYQTLAPTAAKADKMMDDRLATPIAADANDFVYQWEASHDYNPAAGLERIEATLLAINSADDERNPPETGITDAALKHVKNGRLYLIPASTETRGHLTTGNAKFYKQQLQELLQSAPQRTM